MELKAFHKELSKLKNLKLKFNEDILEFFYKNFLNISEMQLEIFKTCLNQGRVVMSFDGYDEICEAYKETVVQIVSTLGKVSSDNKFIISTRPEWKDFLENEFHTFSYSFHPFSQNQRVEFLIT